MDASKTVTHINHRAGFAGLADVAMTRIAQLTTEISIVVQLLGSITGGIAQVGEAGASGLTEIWSNTRDVLITGSGRLLMEMVTAAEIWPLCMVTRLRQVDNWVYEEANNTFINDEEMQKRLLETNPNSFRKLVSTFLEANGRGYWETSEENLEK